MAKEEGVGYIYILTNPSFKEYVKIGYADDVEGRVKQLNRSECTPFGFRIYATYKVNDRLKDMPLHDIIDQLNPNLRSIDNIGGKKRVREFYAMSPEDAYSLLEGIAKINCMEGNLKKHRITKEESEEAEIAEEIEAEHIERRSPFAFSKCGIEIGSEVHSLEHPEIICVVKDDKHVEYNGKDYALSYLAKEILGWKHLPQGPAHFTYNGEILDDLRKRLESK